MLAIFQAAFSIEQPRHLVFIVVKGSTSAGDRHNLLNPIFLPLSLEKDVYSCAGKLLSQFA